MRRTYITNMPDKAGAFLTASRVIANSGGNIVRVNYNKAVDANALFLEVDASEKGHESIDRGLKEIEYLTDDPGMRQIILIELRLPDRPGTLLPTLEVIKGHEVNIPYINSQENGTPYQNFKMGLLVENTTEIKDLIDELSMICEVHVLDYEATDRLLDSTVFYVTFANELRELLDLTQTEANGVLECANGIMQTLDERDESPRKAFDTIRRFAQYLHDHSGKRFDATITALALTSDLTLHVIEPPCGSNVYILEHKGSLLFVNAGYACYANEIDSLITDLFPAAETGRRSVIITDADIATAGSLSLFDTIYVSESSYESFVRERRGRPNHRERDPQRAPYCALSKIITRYEPPRLGRCAIIGEREDDGILEPIGCIRFGNWTFEVYEGAGGHIRGEIIIVCAELKIVFAGNLITNTESLSGERRELEDLLPELMTSTDVDPVLADSIRDRIHHDYKGYMLCPGRGPVINE